VSHPSEAEWWSWDDGNESELAAHSISAPEVEQVFNNGPLFVPNKKRRAGDWKMVGLTDGGRPLTVILRYDGNSASIRPITGWEPTAGERTKYFQQGPA